MQMIKGKIMVLGSLLLILTGITLVMMPIIDYAISSLSRIVSGQAAINTSEAMTLILRIIASEAGYIIAGMVMIFLAVPACKHSVKKLSRESKEYRLLLQELKAHDLVSNTSPNSYGKIQQTQSFSLHELTYLVNKYHLRSGGDARCYNCVILISENQNEKFRGTCPDCYYRRKGMLFYAWAMLFMLVSLALSVIATKFNIILAWWPAIGAIGTGLLVILVGHYFRHSKPRV